MRHPEREACRQCRGIPQPDTVKRALSTSRSKETNVPNVRISRRMWIGAGAAQVACVATGWPIKANAQVAWPNRLVKIVELSAAGGSSDVIARLIANKLSPRIGQPVVVENRLGAGGMVGIESVVRSPADGYTLLMTTTAAATGVASGKKSPYDFLKDLVPVGQVASSPLLIVVPAESPIRTLKDLVEVARGRPDGGISYGSSGVGTMSHIGMELLASQARVKFLHVPYRGVSLSVTDMLAGRLQALLGTVATHAAMLESGRVRGIVVAGPQRFPLLPNLPTSAEAGFPDYLIEFSWGLMAPAGVPPEVIKRLNEEINTIVAQPDTHDLLTRLAAVPKTGTADDFGKLMSFEVARWSKLIKDSNITLE